MDKSIQEQKELINKLKQDNMNKLSQLHSIHQAKLKQLQIEHEKELYSIKKQYQFKEATANTSPSTKKGNSINNLIEQALIEFEQEQHYHAPTLTTSNQIDHQNCYTNKGRMLIRNQQWYTKKYVPVDALSWPVPQMLPHHLKRVPQQQQIC